MELLKLNALQPTTAVEDMFRSVTYLAKFCYHSPACYDDYLFSRH